MSMPRRSELSDAELEKHYSELLADEYANGLSSWTEDNDEEPFNAKNFLDFAKEEAEAIHNQTQSSMESFRAKRADSR